VIYLHTSVVLAELFVEERRAPVEIWAEPFVSSRLLEYELWNRIHARGAARSHGDAARAVLGRTSLVELLPPVLARALEPFSIPVRTLDALHLATLEHLRAARQDVLLATLDGRMRSAAGALTIPLAF